LGSCKWISSSCERLTDGKTNYQCLETLGGNIDIRSSGFQALAWVSWPFSFWEELQEASLKKVALCWQQWQQWLPLLLTGLARSNNELGSNHDPSCGGRQRFL
jgi:hypothetical protein